MHLAALATYLAIVGLLAYILSSACALALLPQSANSGRPTVDSVLCSVKLVISPLLRYNPCT